MIHPVFPRVGKRHVEHAVDDELAFHLEMRARQLMQQGWPEERAREEARRQFGDVAGVRSACVALDHETERHNRRSDMLGDLRQDVTYGARTLRRSALSSIVVVLTLALGIGANTSIFTLVDAVLLRPLPVPHPEQLVKIGDDARLGGTSFSSAPRGDCFSWPLFQAIAAQPGLTSGLYAEGTPGRLDLAAADGGEPEHPRGRMVSGSFFSVLGVPALRGRTFDAREDAAGGGSPVTVISYGWWQRRFHGDPDIIGRSVTLNNTALTIIGVTPPWFEGDIIGTANDLWIPVTEAPQIRAHQPLLDNRGAYWLTMMGRLAPAVTLARAAAGYDALIRQDIRDHQPGGADLVAKQVRNLKFRIESGARGYSRVRGLYYQPLITLMIGVGLLMLIVCANVANLLMARAVARGREMSVRQALGAGRTRLLRQLLTESLLLGTAGAAAGLLLSYWGSRALLALAADGTAIPLHLGLDAAVVGFTALLAVAAVLLFGLVPALRGSSVDLGAALRGHARAVTGVLGGRGSRVPLGRILIAVQVALSLVLLLGAGLLVRSLLGVENADTGIDRDHLLIAEVNVRGAGYTGDRLMNYAKDLDARLAALPGVTAASFSENGIFSGTESSTNLEFPGYTVVDASDTNLLYDETGPGYFTATGAHLLDGRDFTASDVEHAERVMIVNESMARHYWPGSSAVGRTVTYNDTIPVRIVGVVADIRDHDLVSAPQPRFYVPWLQRQFGDPSNIRFELRAAGNPAALSNAVRRELRAEDSAVPISSIDPLTELMRYSIREQRLLTRLAAGFGVMALLLAAIGLYGVMTYAVSRRTGEIGLRGALGASRADLLGMVLADAMKVVGIGVVLGVPAALAATRLLRSQLHGIGTMDPVALGISLSVLMGTAFLASLLPALRASRVAPIVALSQE